MKTRYRRAEKGGEKTQQQPKSTISMGKTGTSTTLTRNWNFQENSLYIEFLKENKRSFEDESTRRSSKIFLEMSLSLRTKSPEQCRTHHQKIMTKYGTLDMIIAYFTQTIALKEQAKHLAKSPTVALQQCESYSIFWSDGKHFKIKINLREIA